MRVGWAGWVAGMGGWRMEDGGGRGNVLDDFGVCG